MSAMAAEPRLGTRIRRARERKRWTQQRLADELTVSVRTVNDWENDRSYPRNSVGALEDKLGVSLDEDEAVPPRAVPPLLRREITALVDDEETRERIIGLLEGTLTWPGERE